MAEHHVNKKLQFQSQFQIHKHLHVATEKLNLFVAKQIRIDETTKLRKYDSTKLRTLWTYETTKLRNYETTKLRALWTKPRNYECQYGTTKLRNYETTNVV
jgi:hypothetical protein